MTWQLIKQLYFCLSLQKYLIKVSWLWAVARIITAATAAQNLKMSVKCNLNHWYKGKGNKFSYKKFIENLLWMEYLKTATFIAYFILILEFNGKYKITVYHGTFDFGWLSPRAQRSILSIVSRVHRWILRKRCYNNNVCASQNNLTCHSDDSFALNDKGPVSFSILLERADSG